MSIGSILIYFLNYFIINKEKFKEQYNDETLDELEQLDMFLYAYNNSDVSKKFLILILLGGSSISKITEVIINFPFILIDRKNKKE
jgi:hypothetical protein